MLPSAFKYPSRELNSVTFNTQKSGGVFLLHIKNTPKQFTVCSYQHKMLHILIKRGDLRRKVDCYYYSKIPNRVKHGNGGAISLELYIQQITTLRRRAARGIPTILKVYYILCKLCKGVTENTEYIIRQVPRRRISAQHRDAF